MALGGVVYTVVPFYKRARKVEGAIRFIFIISYSYLFQRGDGAWRLEGVV